jgi:Transglycosylase SLT domain
MQQDGNAVLYDRNAKCLWSTNTGGLITPRSFVMQNDGNLVLYSTDDAAHWASNTYGNPGAFFDIQDDGNLVVYRAGSQTETPDNALWAAGSNDPWNLAGGINIGDVDYSPYSRGGDIHAWIVQACQSAGLPASSGWVNGFVTLCQRESGYNPNAVNTTDSNAWGPIVGDGNPQHCSRGTAQCIPDTFALYHVGGMSAAIYDPVANIAAASQYVRDRYGVSPDGSDFAAKVQQADPSRPPHGYQPIVDRQVETVALEPG